MKTQNTFWGLLLLWAASNLVLAHIYCYKLNNDVAACAGMSMCSDIGALTQGSIVMITSFSGLIGFFTWKCQSSPSSTCNFMNFLFLELPPMGIPWHGSLKSTSLAFVVHRQNLKKLCYKHYWCRKPARHRICIMEHFIIINFTLHLMTSHTLLV